MDYKYFGLLATIILVCGLLFVIYKWPQGRHKTFSQHVAARRTSIIYYSSLFLVVLPLLLLFFIHWFTPYFGLTIWFNVFIILASVFQITCTFVPETGEQRIKWHRSLAGISAIFLVPTLIILLLAPTIGAISKILIMVALAAMLGCIYIVVQKRGNPRNFLIIQSTYYAAFLLPIVFISYL